MEKKRILIIDDDLAEARLLKLNLEQTGQYEARVEIWPQDAVAAAHAFNPHLAILDILMPRMVGGNVAAAFEDDSLLKDLPVIFLTGFLQKHQMEEHQGVLRDHPCLAKPVDLQVIVKSIEGTLARKGGPAPSCERMLPKEANDED